MTLTIRPPNDNRILIDPAWHLAVRNADARGYLAHKDQRSRVGRFVDWLDHSGAIWHRPALDEYRDHLLQARGLAPATVKAHLATIRGRYQQLLADNATRDLLYAMVPKGTAPSDAKAYVDEMLTRLDNATKAHQSKVKITTVQDVEESKHVRLTPPQVQQLLAAPGIDTVKGLRDTALLALMACTGIREAEAAALDVDDLRQRVAGVEGVLALRVRDGKGRKQRLVPYGALDWCLLLVDGWLEAAGISEGAVFRGLYRGGKVREGRMTTRAIIDVVQAYPVMIDGQAVTVSPHDLRRTYARNLYVSGMGIEEIRQNLGHADIKTTQGYIGTLDAARRKPPAVYVSPYAIKAL